MRSRWPCEAAKWRAVMRLFCGEESESGRSARGGVTGR
jgi:hypothetical protein